MANHLSALKRVRQTRKKTSINRVPKTQVRHEIRALRRAFKEGDANALTVVLKKTIRMIDRAAQKGVLKKNTAARYKSRLSVRAKAALAPKS